MVDRGIARKGYNIYSQDNKVIGKVTSGTYSSNLGKFIGMAYVDMEFSLPDRDINIEIRNKLYAARIKKLPFIEARVRG